MSRQIGFAVLISTMTLAGCGVPSDSMDKRCQRKNSAAQSDSSCSNLSPSNGDQNATAETPAFTPEATATATATPTPAETNTEIPSATPTEIPTATETPESIPTATATTAPTSTPEPATPTPTSTATAIPTATTTETATSTPLPTATPEPTQTTTPMPTATPSASPLPTPFSHQAVQFNGTDQFIQINDKAIVQKIGSFSFWFKSNGGGVQYLISKNMVGSGVGEIRLLLEATGKLKFQIDNAATSLNILSDNVVTDNIWHHVVATFPGMKLYIDGLVQKATNSANIKGMELTNVFLEFGRSNGDTNYYFIGNLDEISLYDLQLDQDQVNEIYNTGKPNDLSGLSTSGNLKSWWRMGEGDNPAGNLYDNKGAYDGIFMNMGPANITSAVPAKTKS